MRRIGFLIAMCGSMACSVAREHDQTTAQQSTTAAPAIVISIVAGSEKTAQTPPGWTPPDEHTSVQPLPGQPGTFLVFTAGRSTGGLPGAIAMTTTNFVDFADAAPFGYDSPVLSPLERTGAGICTPGIDTLFDDNYAAPGTVLPDPAAPGSWLMIYEAENHCRSDTMVSAYYASAGVARSFDQGRTWPAPAFQSPGYDAPTRYVAVSSQTPEPAHGDQHVGDAIPSAIVDNGYLYIYYLDVPDDGTPNRIEVARATDDGRDPMTFWKFTAPDTWTTPAATRDGFVAGSGSSLIDAPAGFQCRQPSVYQVVHLGLGQPLYAMIVECDNLSTAGADKPQGAWFYATTSSLQTQQWSALAPIANTQQLIDCTTSAFDGFYPSFVSPDLPPGQLGQFGHALYLDGELTGPRTMGTRRFQISGGTPAAFQPLASCGCTPPDVCHRCPACSTETSTCLYYPDPISCNTMFTDCGTGPSSGGVCL